MSGEHKANNFTEITNFKFLELFDLEEIQKLQDLFSVATGVATLITETDGTPITKPSGFCCLCNDLIRKTEVGLKNCLISDSIIGRSKEDGPSIQRCFSGGLIDAGASIIVEGKHIANWLIGQVLDEDYKIEDLLNYADVIGVDRGIYMEELSKVKRMSKQQFEDVCNFLYLNAQQLSKYAIKNINLTQEINQRLIKEAEIEKINNELEERINHRTLQLEELNSELEETNAILEEEVIERQRVEDEIRILNEELENKVLERTCQLQAINSKLETEITERIKIEDILRESEYKFKFLSYHDNLTGLFNRRYYEEEIKRMDVEENLPISIIMGDVNSLKLVNDAFGHDRGDELLQKAATCIQTECRAGDVVARWGGDEFVILLPRTTSEEAKRIVKKIKVASINQQVNAIHMSISFGWASKERGEDDILKVLKNAEDHMYRLKTIENAGLRGNVIGTIINTLHEKNPREEQHSKRVSDISQRIGRALDLPEMEISSLRIIGLLHDIGKIAIEESILNKPTKLTDLEWEEVKQHPSIGYRILSSSNDMLELAELVLLHHERWDGGGYPHGIKGEAIPMLTRIITLADSYDAMTSARPYRKPLKEEEATLEIKNNAGIQFDPYISRIFIEKVIGRPWD